MGIQIEGGFNGLCRFPLEGSKNGFPGSLKYMDKQPDSQQHSFVITLWGYAGGKYLRGDV